MDEIHTQTNWPFLQYSGFKNQHPHCYSCVVKTSQRNTTEQSRTGQNKTDQDRSKVGAVEKRTQHRKFSLQLLNDDDDLLHLIPRKRYSRLYTTTQ